MWKKERKKNRRKLYILIIKCTHKKKFGSNSNESRWQKQNHKHTVNKQKFRVKIEIEATENGPTENWKVSSYIVLFFFLGIVCRCESNWFLMWQRNARCFFMVLVFLRFHCVKYPKKKEKNYQNFDPIRNIKRKEKHHHHRHTRKIRRAIGFKCLILFLWSWQ